MAAIDVSVYRQFVNKKYFEGDLTFIYSGGSGSGGDLSNYATISYVDGLISSIDASLSDTYNAATFFVPESSFNDSYFKWVGGYLEPSIATGGGTGDVTKLYVDGSLARRDTSINALFTKNLQQDASLNDTLNIFSFTCASSYIDGSLARRDTSINALFTKNLQQDASLNDVASYYSIDPSIYGLNAKCSADVTMTNATTWYNGTSLSIPAGTWLIMGTITMGRVSTTAIRYSARISTGSTHYASASQYAPSVNPHYISIALSSIITLSSTTTIYLSGYATTGSCVIKAAVADGASGNNATQLSAIKIRP
jgi:hypothetical protein